MKKIIATISSLDTSGGAGATADMKAFSTVSAHGYVIITCLTFQTPDKVYSIQPLDRDYVEEQIKCLFSEVKPDFIKTGMIYSKDILKCLSDFIEDRDVKVVADPVFKASDGTDLCEKGYVDIYEERFLPLVYLLTPNLDEGMALSGEKNPKDILRKIYEKGAENVLLKGGHFKEKYSTDTLFDGKKFIRFSLPRIRGYRWHGTGCMYSSLIAGNLAKGFSLRKSIDSAKRILWSMMMNSYSIRGCKTRLLGDAKEFDIPPCLNKERFEVWFELNKFVKKLIRILSSEFIPEVGINVGYALENARDRKDICALDGRITKAKTYGLLRFGASKHVASVILTAMKFESDRRSAMNIKYSEEILKKFEEKGFLISSFSREEEPKDRSTMEWGTEVAIREIGKVPDVIYDKGHHGKEAMIRLIGKNPRDLISKIMKVL